MRPVAHGRKPRSIAVCNVVKGKTLAVVVAVFVSGCAGPSPTVVGVESALSYVLSCRKPDGGFGPRYQYYSAQEWTDDAIEALALLGAPVPYEKAARRFVTKAGTPPYAPNRETYRRLATFVRLGLPVPRRAMRRIRALQRADGGWPEADGHTTLSATYWGIAILALAKTVPRAREAAGRFLISRMYPDGHFAETPRPRAPAGGDTSASRSDSTGVGGERGHLWLTYAGVMGLTALGYEVPWKPAVLRWLRSCQQPDGGFSWRPGRGPVGGSDIWYTALATRALRTLDAAPKDSAGAVAYINACQNGDGGFGDRPSWNSRLAATKYALLAAESLSGDAARAIHPKVLAAPADDAEALRGLSAYHLYEGPVPAGNVPGAMNRWSSGVPVYLLGRTFAEAEPYLLAPRLAVGDSTVEQFLWQISPLPFVVRLAGGMRVTCSVGFWIPNGAQPDTLEALRRAWSLLSTEGRRDTLTWDRFREKVIAPLAKRGVMPFLQVGKAGQMLDYLLADEVLRDESAWSVVGALSDGTDFARAVPSLERMGRRVPLVVSYVPAATPASDRARVVWLGERGDIADFAEALRRRRVACAVRDERAPGGIVLYGDQRVVDALAGRRAEIVWWRGDGEGEAGEFR